MSVQNHLKAFAKMPLLKKIHSENWYTAPNSRGIEHSFRY